MEDPKPPRRRGLLSGLARRMAFVLVPIVVAIGCLPWLAGVGAIRSMVLAQVNKTYAPTVIEVETVAVSWLGPVKLTGVVLRDREGKAVVSAPTGSLNRSLVDLIFNRPDYGTLTLDQAVVDIERHADGRIDLAEALGPLLASDPDKPGDPNTDFTLKIEAGTLLLKSPELLEPIEARRLDMTLHAAPAPGPLAWDILLNDPAKETVGPPPEEAVTLRVVGTLDHRAEGSPLKVSIDGMRWPIAAGLAGVEVRGNYAGSVVVAQEGTNPYRVAGDLKMLAATASGPALRGDAPSLGDVAATFGVRYGEPGLTIDSATFQAPFGNLQAAAPGGADQNAKYTGRVDLPTLARLFPKALRLREGLVIEKGTLNLDLSLADAGEEGRKIDLAADLSDLAARDATRAVALTEPMSVRASLRQKGEEVVVDAANVETPFLKAKGQGDLAQGIALSGSADLDALEKQARQFLDLGAISVAGRARFAGDLKRDEKAAEPAYNARVAIEANELRVAGLTTEPIARPTVRADFVLQGPLGESGMPADWSRAWATIKTGGTTVQAQVAGSAASLAMSTRVEGPISEISALIGSPMDDPTAVVAAVDAAYQAGTDQLAITAARLDTAYGAIQGAGTLNEVSTRMVADLSGTVAPNFETLQQLVATQAGTPVALAGQPRAFHVRGALKADSLNTLVRQIDAEVGLDLRGASMAGMEMGPAAVVLRAANGGVGIDPIRSSLNNGQVELRPGIELRPDGSALFVLGEGSAIEGAEINETLSRQLLSYIAPVLHEATQVNGKVSARFQHLTMIVAGPGSGAMSMDMAAQVHFQQVAYGPGPLAQQIMVLGGMPNVPQLVIDQPVDVTVVQGRVTQSGLAVQVAPEIQFKLEGSVGLDSTLALRAGVPLSARMLGRQEAVTEILGGTVVGVPIGGTMSRPVLDRAAFQVALRQSAGQVINRAAARGANELLKGLVGDAPLPGAASEGGTPATGNLEDVGRGLLRQLIPGGPPRE